MNLASYSESRLGVLRQVASSQPPIYNAYLAGLCQRVNCPHLEGYTNSIKEQAAPPWEDLARDWTVTSIPEGSAAIAKECYCGEK